MKVTLYTRAFEFFLTSSLLKLEQVTEAKTMCAIWEGKDVPLFSTSMKKAHQTQLFV